MERNYVCGVVPLGVATGCYIIYMELSPSMGNIWWRDGRVSVRGAVMCMLYPLREWRMWTPSMWSANWFMWLAGGTVVSWLITSDLLSSQPRYIGGDADS